MVEFAGEYILSKVLLVTEGITRRALMKAGEQVNNKFGQERAQAVNDMIVALEKETTQILDCLASQQQSKVHSAYQYVRFALSDLQAWNDELNTSIDQRSSCASSGSLSCQISDTASYISAVSSSPTFSVASSTSSKYFRDALWQLRQADEWATEAFNDKRNSRGYVRMEALHIRLFCRALLDWDNRRLWFAKWRQVLEPFFSDRQFVRYSMGEQSFTSRLFSDERAETVRDRFNHLTKCLESLMWSMVLKEPSLGPYAREFALHFDKYTTLANDLKVPSIWSGLRTFHLSYYDLTEDIELKLCADKLVIRLYEFKAITSTANGQVWAIENTGRLVSFDSKHPQVQTLVTSTDKRWLSLGHASDKKKVFATAEGDTHVSVFDADTGKLIEYERYNLPPTGRQSIAYRLKTTPTGTILMCDKGNGKGFIKFTNDGCPKWYDLANGEYDELVQGSNENEVIGLTMRENSLIGHVISVENGQAVISETISHLIQLPQQIQAYLIARNGMENTGSVSSEITIMCQTEKLNYLINVEVQRTRNEVEKSVDKNEEIKGELRGRNEGEVKKEWMERNEVKEDVQWTRNEERLKEEWPEKNDSGMKEELERPDGRMKPEGTMRPEGGMRPERRMSGAEGRMSGAEGTAKFIVKDVRSFQTEYTDWQMIRDMVCADEKLFVLFK